MDYSNTAIKNLHNFVIPTEKFNNFLEDLIQSHKINKFIKQYKISNNGIIVIKSLISHLNPRNLVISTYGLKEGVRFNLLPESEKTRDIILDKCTYLAGANIKHLNLDSYIKLFSSIMLEMQEDEIKLLKASILLSQTTLNIERNYKADWIINFLLTVDIPLNQVQRATLIIALSGVFASKQSTLPNKSIWSLLDKRQSAFAQSVGAFTKIAMLLDGTVLSSPSFVIKERDNFLEIDVDNIIPKNIFDKICEQLKIMGISRKIWLNSKQIY